MPPSDPQPARPSIPRFFQFILFCAAGAWYLAARVVAGKAARGIGERFDIANLQAAMGGVFTLFLVVFGYALLDWIATRDGKLDGILLLPRRPGYGGEWGIGVAVGWGLALAAIVPLMLTGNLHVHVLLGRGTAGALFTGLFSLAVLTLVEEVALHGYLFRRLMGAVGTTLGTLLLSVCFAIALIQDAALTDAPTALVTGTLFGILLAMAYLRTHALWLGWGMHFAYRAVMAVLFGLPIVGHAEYSSLIDSDATGPRWLRGGDFGLDAAFFTVLLLPIAMIVLYRLTREYAWHYTHVPIVSAGYEVTVAPPAAHVAMEKAAAPPALVQILSSTPQNQTLPQNLPPGLAVEESTDLVSDRDDHIAD